MSYIKPEQYYQIAEQMAEAYSRIRDVLNDGTPLETIDDTSWADIIDIATDYGATANANDFSVNIVKMTVEEEDDNSDTSVSILHDDTRDPVGSIAADLGTKFRDFGQVFTEAQAKVIAAAFFSSAIVSLNNHVVNRTPLPPTIPQPPGGSVTMRNINEYYSAYGDDPRVFGDGPETGSEMGLFTWQADSTGDYFTGGYFSDNFVEMCTTLNITINDEFKDSTWA